jgi:hypothetical protein
MFDYVLANEPDEQGERFRGGKSQKGRTQKLSGEMTQKHTATFLQ